MGFAFRATRYPRPGDGLIHEAIINLATIVFGADYSEARICGDTGLVR